MLLRTLPYAPWIEWRKTWGVSLLIYNIRDLHQIDQKLCVPFGYVFPSQLTRSPRRCRSWRSLCSRLRNGDMVIWKEVETVLLIYSHSISYRPVWSWGTVCGLMMPLFYGLWFRLTCRDDSKLRRTEHETGPTFEAAVFECVVYCQVSSWWWRLVLFFFAFFNDDFCFCFNDSMILSW